MTRASDVARLYDGLAVFARRARELSSELHPGLSLVAYTVLSYVDTRPDARASDVAADWGLEKSTVSRQIDQLVVSGLMTREGERPGRRGHALGLTPAGHHALYEAAESIRTRLYGQLKDWTDRDIAAFARLLARFNDLPD